MSRNLGNVRGGTSLALSRRMRDDRVMKGRQERTGRIYFVCLLWPPGGSSKDGNLKVKGHQGMRQQT